MEKYKLFCNYCVLIVSCSQKNTMENNFNLLPNSPCQLCNSVGGELILSNSLYRIVHVLDPDYLGYIRLIINQHIKEMTDLSLSDRHEVFSALMSIERVLRDELNPDKINIATLGNMTPHVHWHIIPRYVNDKHFPNPIW